MCISILTDINIQIIDSIVFVCKKHKNVLIFGTKCNIMYYIAAVFNKWCIGLAEMIIGLIFFWMVDLAKLH